MQRQPVTRESVIRSARLHHVLGAISTIYYGLPGSQWIGDDERGEYRYDNMQGENVAIRWEPSADGDSPGPLIALVYTTESDRNEGRLAEAQRRPLRHLSGLPDEYGSLATAMAADMQQLVTAGFWTSGRSEAEWSDPLPLQNAYVFAHGLERFTGFLVSPTDALFRIWQPWAELFSLDSDDDNPDSHAMLALRLSEASRAGQVAIDVHDNAILMRHPDGVSQEPDDVAAAVDLFWQIGIRWTPPS